MDLVVVGSVLVGGAVAAIVGYVNELRKNPAEKFDIKKFCFTVVTGVIVTAAAVYANVGLDQLQMFAQVLSAIGLTWVADIVRHVIWDYLDAQKPAKPAAKKA